MEVAVTPARRKEGAAKATEPWRAARETRPEAVYEIERAAPRVVAVAGKLPEKAEQPGAAAARHKAPTTTRLSISGLCTRGI